MKSRRDGLPCLFGVLLVLVALGGHAQELSWSPRAEVTGESFGRGLHAAGVIDNTIYVAGGGFIASSLWISYRSARAYDPVADSWSPRADMPSRRTAPGSAVAAYMGQERLYVIGGADLTGFPTDHFVHPDMAEYDPVTNSWRTVGAGMPDADRLWGPCAVVVDNLVYVMGGADADLLGASSRLVAYNPDSDSFTTLAAMPIGASDGACAVVGRRVYYFGGYLTGWWGGLPSSHTFVYDIDSNSWQDSPTPIPEPRANAAAIAIGTKVYVVGGWDGSGTYSGMYNTVDAYDASLDQWTVGVADPLGCVEDDGLSERGRAGLTLHEANDSFADLVYAVGGNVGISLPTRCNESSPRPVLSLIFPDGFESGGTSMWSVTVP